MSIADEQNIYGKSNLEGDKATAEKRAFSKGTPGRNPKPHAFINEYDITDQYDLGDRRHAGQDYLQIAKDATPGSEIGQRTALSVLFGDFLDKFKKVNPKNLRVINRDEFIAKTEKARSDTSSVVIDE